MSFKNLNNYITQDGDTNAAYLMIPLGTKSRARANKKGKQVWNDILNCVTFTQSNHPKDSPNFLAACEELRVSMWAMVHGDDEG